MDIRQGSDEHFLKGNHIDKTYHESSVFYKDQNLGRLFQVLIYNELFQLYGLLQSRKEEQLQR